MPGGVNGEGNDRLFCREQVIRTNHLFRVSHIFADKPVADRLVPLHAFFSAIEEVCTSVSDESVAARKLEWWREEMRDCAHSASNHPVVAELRRTGAAAEMPVELVTRILDAAALRIDSGAPGSEEELKALCRITGLPQVELEMAVCGATPEEGPLISQLAVRRGLLQLIREGLGHPGQEGFWWIPLKLMARHGLSRMDMYSEKRGENARLLMSDIFALDETEETSSTATIADISIQKQYITHLFVLDVMVGRKLGKMNFISPVCYREELARLRIGDIFSCWKTARKINRLK